MNIPTPNEAAPTATDFADKVALELNRRTGPGVSPAVHPRTPDADIDDVIAALELKGWATELSVSHADYTAAGRVGYRTLVITAA